MTNDANRKPGEEGRVLKFRPRETPRTEAFSNLKTGSASGGGPERHANNGGDDYAHRMKVNAIAVAFLAALVGGGIWVVDMMAQQRKTQDCILTGRRNCSTGTFTPSAR